MKTRITFITLCILFITVVSHLRLDAHEHFINVNNQDRSYLLYLPQNYEAEQQLPLHVFLHGGGFSKEEAEQTYGFTAHANTSGYILVYPQGLNNNWNRDNDFVFISSLIDTLSKNYKVDKRKVYLSGHSSGGMMTFLLASELSHKIAAFGDVCGIMYDFYGDFYNNAKPVPYIKIHGTTDPVIPYNGNNNMLSVDSVLGFWKNINNATTLESTEDLPNISTTDNSTVTKYTYRQGNSEVVFYKIIGGGHDSPGWTGDNEMGNTNRDINAPEVLWDFFKNHTLSGAKVSFIANAGFLVESGNKKILIDALFNNGYGQYSVPSASIQENIINGIAPFDSVDVHFVSHNHADHFNPGLVAQQLYNNPALYMVGPTIAKTQLSTSSNYDSFKDRVLGVSPGFDAFKDTVANSIPVKVIRMHHDTRDFENNAYLFEIDGLKILHIGDYTGDVPSDLDIYNLKEENIDIAFVNYFNYFDNIDKLNMVKEGINAKHTVLYHIELSAIHTVADSCKNIPNCTAFGKSFESSYFNDTLFYQINTAPQNVEPMRDTIARVAQNFSYNISGFFSDIYDFLTYEAKLNNGELLPDWLNFNSNSGTFSGIPETEETLQIKVTVTDYAGSGTSDVFNLEIQSPSGIVNIEKQVKDFTVYPNPASHSIQINNKELLPKNSSFKIVDSSGKTISSGILTGAAINISDMPKGIYVLSVVTGEGIFSEKLIIE